MALPTNMIKLKHSAISVLNSMGTDVFPYMEWLTMEAIVTSDVGRTCCPDSVFSTEIEARRL